MSRPALRYRGIWASLHFGFLAPPQVLSQGQTQEGAQILEDGTEFRDQDWVANDQDATLPLAFGFAAPAGGCAREASGTFRLFEATLAGLGRWHDKVAQVTGASRFKVLLDQDRARLFGYHEALKTYVPVLWVDRAGSWVEFRWFQKETAGTTAFTVQVLNADSQGVQVAWTAQEPGTAAVELLRADFIGLPAPSFLVQGYAGAASTLPAALAVPSGAVVLPVSMAVGGPVGRPTLLQWGTFSGQPDFEPGLPRAPAQPVFPVQEWNFAYADAGLNELRALRAPSGATSTFTFQTYAFPGCVPLLRGVSESLTQDPETATTCLKTWNRTTPGTPGGPWTVSFHAITAGEGTGTQEHAARYTFVDAGRGDANGFLQDQEPSGTVAPTRLAVKTDAAGDVLFTTTGTGRARFMNNAVTANGDRLSVEWVCTQGYV